jgi:hypothetical protein
VNSTAFEIQFPNPKKEIIVPTGLMQRTVKRTLAVHSSGGLIIWQGRSRIGKTTTARWMIQKIEEAYDPDNSICFRAKHYEAGEISSWQGQEAKRGIRSLYHATIGRLDEGIYRQDPTEHIAAQLVHSLRRTNIQMVLVDEAGWLSLDAIRGMVLVCDVAKNLNWTLTLVFIGMDDLPQKLTKLPQINGRIHEWCYFEPYNLDETWKLLADLSPYFAKLDGRKAADREQVEFVHETFGGVPGEIVPFVQRLEHRLKEHKGEVDTRLLRAVHLLTSRDKERSIQDSKFGYKVKPDNENKQTPLKDNGKKKRTSK